MNEGLTLYVERIRNAQNEWVFHTILERGGEEIRQQSCPVATGERGVFQLARGYADKYNETVEVYECDELLDTMFPAGEGF